MASSQLDIFATPDAQEKPLIETDIPVFLVNFDKPSNTQSFTDKISHG